MTGDGVRAGGSPRVPRPGEAEEFDAGPVAAPSAAPGAAPGAAPSAGQPAPDDWLAPPAPPAPPTPAAAAARFADDALVDETLADEPLADEQPEDAEPVEAPRPRLSLVERLKRTPPALVILAIAAIGSTGFLVYELASRTAPIAVLSSAAFVTGLCYVAITVVCAVATYRSSSDGRTWRALLLAFIGGTAAIIAAMSFAGGLVLVLALGF